jgi:putative ABC transport system permease protein
MTSLADEVRFALRSLWRVKALAAAAAAVLALGIGANTAIFSGVNALLLRPLPFRDPERLGLVFETLQTRRSARLTVSAPAVEDLRASGAFEQVAAVARTPGSLDLGDRAVPVTVLHATSDFLPILGTTMQLGRAFEQGERDTAIVSDQLFRRELRADPALLGRPLVVDGVQRRVIGVLPARISSFFMGDVWTPLAFTPEQLQPDRREYGIALVLARLRPDSAAQVDRLAARLREQHPESGRGGFLVVPLRQAFLGELRPALLLLMAAVAVVLLIACANVANLLTARAAARQRELAVRSALGADRLALARQLVGEGLVLAAAGCALGLLLALWAIELLVPLGSEAIRSSGLEVDGRVLAFAAAISVVAGAAAALVPALQATRPDLAVQLKDGARRLSGGGRRRLRDALASAEVALALVLLIAAGHDFLAYRRLLRIDPGFDARGALAMEIALPPARFADPAAQRQFFSKLIERLSVLPGVQAAGFAAGVPLSAPQTVWHFEVEGPGGRGSGHVVDAIQVYSAHTLRALGVPLLAGRAFGDDDGRVALVNQAFARRYWPSEEALGKKIRPYRFHFEDASGRRFWALDEPAFFTVVGVIGDVREWKLSVEPRPEVVLPLHQFPLPEGAMIVRGGTAAAVRAALDPEVALQQIAPLDEIVAASAEEQRDPMILLAVLALLALLMAGMGLYGVMSWVVAERGRELSVRMAMGADAVDVLRLLLRQGMTLASAGIAAGLAAAVLLEGLAKIEPILCVFLCAALLLVALVASWIPARRAARIDPRIAFRLD